MVVFLDGWVVAWERAEQRGVRLISESCARPSRVPRDASATELFSEKWARCRLPFCSLRPSLLPPSALRERTAVRQTLSGELFESS